MNVLLQFTKKKSEVRDEIRSQLDEKKFYKLSERHGEIIRGRLLKCMKKIWRNEGVPKKK